MASRRKKEVVLPAVSESAAFILERSLLSGVVAFVPVPFVDDFLIGRARRVLLRDVAKRAGRELGDDILAELAQQPALAHAASAGAKIFGRALKGMTLPLRFVDRAREALVSFQRATLLDHYLRHHHAGGALSVEDGKALRRRMDAAISTTPFSSLRSMQLHADALTSAFDAAPDRALPP